MVSMNLFKKNKVQPNGAKKSSAAKLNKASCARVQRQEEMDPCCPYSLTFGDPPTTDYNSKKNEASHIDCYSPSFPPSEAGEIMEV